MEDGILVRHREGGDAHDHIEVWDKYIDHIKTVNRFFPSSDLSYEMLNPFGEVIVQNSRSVEVGALLYRGRLTQDPAILDPTAMGKPPSELARGGRGNPTGISHLYLSFDRETCVAECRVGMNEYVSVARFDVSKTFKTLDLQSIDSINPFVGSSENNILSYLRARSVLLRLRDEISAPARSTDSQLDYISTQFLCEYVKSLGISGVIFPSTLRVGGVNLVLFDDSYVECSLNIESYQVHEYQFEIRQSVN
ncbi:MAG: RES family NAD+ phosphorylase [Rhodococcus sp. (in: high G+C Gram-positive bacteria)]|uniref:RES family NAD+ phosphorylase n=1 Tax=Rhodococcus sp. TaxID=1831 RepID=UPI002AD9C162|nr:RES family NAD+ phosphorylase [Rhodococcus sp. (in: high G+C Gram-positive bacteria)]